MVQSKTDPRVLALVVASAQFMAALDSSVIAVAIPHMATDFHVSPVDLSLGMTVYLLTQAALLPSCSWIADRFGARRVFVLAIVGFVLSSMLCGLARNLPEFIAARVLQGASGAMMTPVGRIVVFQATEKKDLVSIVTISTLPMLFAPTLGPPLGGIIVSYWTWPWIFFLNVPIGVASVLLSLHYIPKLAPQGARPFDTLGFFLSGGAIAGVLYGLHEFSLGADRWAIAAGIFLSGLGAMVWAIGHVRRHPTPILSLSALRFPNFRSTRIAGPLCMLPFWSLNFIMPLMLQLALGFSPFVTGMLLLAMSGGDLVVKLATGPILRWMGFRQVIVSGTVAYGLTVAACFFFASTTPPWVIFAVLALNGMTRSALFSAIVAFSFTDVPEEEMSQASVLNSIILQVSGAASISAAAIAISLSSAFKAVPQPLSLADCRLAIAASALACVSSLYWFRAIDRRAGGSISGHASSATLE
jgi:EmrB/QacA subfamily drug resistance transporter